MLQHSKHDVHAASINRRLIVQTNLKTVPEINKHRSAKVCPSYMGVANCIFWFYYVHAVKHHEIYRGHLFILSIFECCAWASIMRAFVLHAKLYFPYSVDITQYETEKVLEQRSRIC